MDGGGIRLVFGSDDTTPSTGGASRPTGGFKWLFKPSRPVSNPVKTNSSEKPKRSTADEHYRLPNHQVRPVEQRGGAPCGAKQRHALRTDASVCESWPVARRNHVGHGHCRDRKSVV